MKKVYFQKANALIKITWVNFDEFLNTTLESLNTFCSKYTAVFTKKTVGTSKNVVSASLPYCYFLMH